jgi:hypothetical protein
VQVKLYASLADAKSQSNLLATAITNSKGQWPISITGYDMVWVRDPAGVVWAVPSDTAAGDHAARLTALESQIASGGATYAPATGSTVYESQAHAAATYAPVSGSAVYESQTHAATAYAPATGSTVYESQTHAASTYETQAHAAATYEAQTSAASTYETQTHASSTYQTSAGLDSSTASLVTTASSTQGALDGRYALPASPAAFNFPMRNSANTGLAWTTSQASVARALGWVIVTDPAYGAKGDGVTDDTTAITNAANAIPNGGTIFFPPHQTGHFYKITGAIPLISSVNYVGAGRAVTEIRATAGNVFAPTGLKSTIVFQGLTLSATSAHVIDLGTGSNGLYQSTIRDCALNALGNGVSIVNGNGSVTWQEVYTENCVLTRQGGATVPGVNLTSSTGGLNGSTWQKLVLMGNNATGTPFFRLETGGGASTYDPVFRDIIGEQNVGGLIWLYSPQNFTIENVTDYDVAGSYTGSLVRIDKGAGAYPRRGRIAGVGNRGGTVNGTTVFHVEIATSMDGPAVLERIGDQLGNRYIKCASPTYGFTSLDGWGASGSVRTSTGAATASDLLDGTLVMNGASLTATLPDPTTVPYGRKFTVKNINASALTVVSAGTSKTIDGAASKSLAQWAWITVQTDSTQWLIVG